MDFNGTCDLRTQRLEVRVSGTSAWSEFSSTTLPTFFNSLGTNNNDCSKDGTFKISLNSMTSVLGGPVSPTQKAIIEIRSVFEIGPSRASTFGLQYNQTLMVNPANFHITQGAGIATAPGIRLEGKIRPIQGGSASNGSVVLTR